jgi:alkylation response protein AidB-like acyl-CoA dehydrogenase
VIDAVRDLLPRIRAAADAIEAGRRLPLELVHAIADAGVFRLCVPRALGGMEAHPAAMVDTLETIATADGSAGWCAMIGATSAIVSGYLPDGVARAIYGDPGVVTGGVFAPRGNGSAGGRRLPGVGALAVRVGERALRVAHGRMPRPRRRTTARRACSLFPASDVQIVDTWNVAGLRGTGSHDMTVDGVVVPAERSVSFMEDRPRASGPYTRFPSSAFLAIGIAAVALGIARAAIDELVRLAREKSPQGSRRTLAERGVVQAHVAEAEALVRSARTFVDDAIARAWRAAESEGTIGAAERAALRLAATHATVSAAKATDLMYDAGGGTSVYATSPLQRCFRDVHVATQHAMVGGSTYELTGRLLLGLETDVSQL